MSEYLLKAARISDLPLALEGRPRAQARIKAVPEDFVVEEVNAIEPDGDGPHLFLWVEKRDVAGGELLRRVARALDIGQEEVGYAGTKDRVAVTRQWLSVPGDCESKLVAGLDMDGVKVLRFARNRRKLRLGHLKGNRFWILLRGADPALAPDLARTGEMVAAKGFPNFYGGQRFGRAGDGLSRALRFVESGGRQRGRGPGRFERRMMVSSVQSALFNRYLLSRIEAGLGSRVVRGDVMTRAETGGLFFVEDVGAEQARLDAGETRITGPMFGNRFMCARDEAGDLERDVLAASGLGEGVFDTFKRLARGTRRVLFEVPSELSVVPVPDGIRLSFFLPRGTYASVLLREFVNVVPE